MLAIRMEISCVGCERDRRAVLCTIEHSVDCGEFKRRQVISAGG